MGKKIVSKITLMLFVAGAITSMLSIQSAKSETKTWIVDDDGPADFNRIQDAINNASVQVGDTVFVKNGTYHEHVVINKALVLFGENTDRTIIDGDGTGSVVMVSVSNVCVSNFTIRNAGKVWSGVGYPPSCVSGNFVTNVVIRNSALTDAAVCVWFYSSSIVDISNNTISNASSMGIIESNSFNVTIHQNTVDSCGLVGIHVDGNSINSRIVKNTVINCLEGIELEQSALNFVGENQLLDNNASILLNQCGNFNVFRKNNMTSDGYNLIIWGWTIEAFVQDIETSNIANNKTAYYLVNSHNLAINPENYPDLGYLALVNCTNATIKNVDLSLNKDGLLIAQSTNCSLANITLDGNSGPLLHGGLTFFKSSNNSIVNSRFSNNAVGVCFYQSAGNTFYHNSFINNEKHVISNFYSPFSPPSGPYMVNNWDNNVEGNYWNDYEERYPNATELEDYGIWDTPYAIDANNQDNFPLMNAYIPGDYNHDGTVDMTDADKVRAAWQARQGEFSYNPHTDYNTDGIINIADAAIIGINWQKHVQPEVLCSYLNHVWIFMVSSNSELCPEAQHKAIHGELKSNKDIMKNAQNKYFLKRYI